MSKLNRKSRAVQRGWSLVESVVVVMLVGVMATGVWKTLDLASKKREVEHSRDVLERADNALRGMVLRDMGLPMPANATAVPEQPNHHVGWLPENVLGTEPPNSIRYIVDTMLVNAPAAVLYQTDPMGLLNGLAVEARSAPNGLDFCLRLIQREQSGVAALNGMNLAFGVQQADKQGNLGIAAQPFQLGTNSAGSAGAQTQLSTRTAGHAELVYSIGCIPAFALLATEVKSAALLNDLHEIAKINADLRALEWRAARDYLRSHQWRLAVGISRLTTHVIKTAINLLSMDTTPAGLPIAVGNVAVNALVIALWAELIDLSNGGAIANAAAMPALQAAHQAAMTFSQNLAAQRDRHIARVNALQSKGVQP